jgi:type I restriction enzyme, S subunit
MEQVVQRNKKTLPAGWRWVRVADLCATIDYGFTASANSSIEGPRFLRITDIQNGNVNWQTVPGCEISPDDEAAKRLVDGDIVFARTGATTGKSFLIRRPPRAVFASYLIRLRLRHEVSADYVYAFFQSDDYWQQIRSSARGGAQPNVNATLLAAVTLPLPPLPEQKRIAAILNEQLSAVEKARTASEAQLEAAEALSFAYVRQSFSANSRHLVPLTRCLFEISKGIGSGWATYRLFGATRAGIAPAKEGVGKNPNRYKLVDEGTIFYNPMRILLGSIAMIDEGDAVGITSPDYVVLKTNDGLLHPRWFYYWLRSPLGDAFIKTLSRGAVRERMLFRRLAEAEVELPSWDAQVEAAQRLKGIRQLKEFIGQQINTINKLSPTILRRAFNGEL